MRTVLASAAVLVGAAFIFVAALGVARMPDLYTRMQAAAKAATVGVVAMMASVAMALAEGPATIRAMLVSAFFLLTSPVAAHAIARSAHTRGVPLAPGTTTEVGIPAGGERRARDRREIGADEPVEGAAAGGARRDEVRS